MYKQIVNFVYTKLLCDTSEIVHDDQSIKMDGSQP